MRTALITPPADEPLDPDEVRQHLRNPEATGQLADDELDRWIQTAREWAEQRVGALLTQTWDVYLEAFPCDPFVLPMQPLQSVVSVKYLDASNVLQTVTAANYMVSAGALSLAPGAAWPTSIFGSPFPVVIRVKVGYADPELIPSSVKSWMLLAITWQSEHRGLSLDRQAFENTYADRLLDRYREVGV